MAAQWDELVEAWKLLSPGVVALAFAFVVLGLFANMLSWREVLDGLGSPLPVGAASRVFLLAQLGKYLPGSIWPLVAQTELARDHGVARVRSAVGGVVALLLGLVVGTLVAMGCLLPTEATEGAWWPWALLLMIPLLVVLHPAVLRRIMLLLLKVTKQPATDVTIEAGSLLRAAGWSLLMWAAMGAQVWALLRDLGGDTSHPFALGAGAYAAAWVTGFLVVVAPAGAGAREAALVLLLTPALGSSGALALAVTSRFLTMAGDGLCALFVVRRGRPQTGRDGAVPGRTATTQQ